VNEGHVWCGSDEWRAHVREVSIPWALGDRDLGDDVLEVGPGYGATTDVFCERARQLTVVEIDPELAAALADRFGGKNVTVVEGDATALEFDDERFTGATCFHMLHHVPSVELQDQIFAEAARVLQPGGLFVATDSIYSAEVEKFHEGDTYLPIDPATLEARLTDAGFADVEIDVVTDRRSWAARARAAAR
jgi:ubiquinone/menaquinone biosynthesis C-methylase UbiE